MSIPTAESFLRNLMGTVKAHDLDYMEVYIGYVTYVDATDQGATIEVRRQSVNNTDVDNGEGMVVTARVVGYTMVIGSWVLMMRVGKEHYCLGRTGGDLGMQIESEHALVSTIEPTWRLDFGAGINVVAEPVVPDEINIDLAWGGAGVTDFVARSDHWHQNEETRGIKTYASDGSPTAASNASTSTYATLYSEVIALPPGTWTVEHIAMAIFKNSVAGNGATMRCALPSVSGGTTVSDPTAAAPFTIFDTGGGSGLSSNVLFSAEYRANGGGTVTPQRWLYLIIARRTG